MERKFKVSSISIFMRISNIAFFSLWYDFFYFVYLNFSNSNGSRRIFIFSKLGKGKERGEVWIFQRVKHCFTINSTRFQYLWEYRLSFSHFLNWYDFSIFVYLNFSNFNESRTNLYFRKSRNERNNSREEVFQYLWEYRLSFFHFDTILLFRLFKLLEFRIFSKVEKWKKRRGSLNFRREYLWKSIVSDFSFTIDTIFPFRLFKLLEFEWMGQGIDLQRVETRESSNNVESYN